MISIMKQSLEHTRRRIVDVLVERMADEPVILLEGPRGVGKSTILRQVATRMGGTIVDLDDLPTRTLAIEDPTLAIDQPPPVFIDEYGHAPDLLSAIKARINQVGSRPGQFVLTGSAGYDTLPLASQALTGRLHRMAILPLSQAELGGAPGLLQRMFDEGADVVSPVLSATTREEYASRIVAGGFPDALTRVSDAARGRWFDDYIKASVSRDAVGVRKVRSPQSLPVVLAALADQTGMVLNVSRVAKKLRLLPDLVASYINLLEGVFLVRRIPAWGRALTNRSARQPKIHVLDSGVATRLMHLTTDRLVATDAPSIIQLGHLAETFVVGEILKEVAWSDGIAAVGHWRTYDEDAVALIVERDDGTFVAMAVGAGSRASQKSFQSLAKLRDKTGSLFKLGVVFHMGARGHRYDDRLVALPIDALWSSPGPSSLVPEAGSGVGDGFVEYGEGGAGRGGVLPGGRRLEIDVFADPVGGEQAGGDLAGQAAAQGARQGSEAATQDDPADIDQVHAVGQGDAERG